ncbi:serine/threonine-protein kinase mos isoform X1 [Leptopilina heterotoma]|uniref:serine/threonine-protein kinase mos isoform X1 n=1 Tax=Leptopilina heterotoma TaxID=63436 RepID=UPI001CA857C7|nr:serine/threonine-protein kinase mos isoform X1 [Leptopilina heterotoma]
MASPQALKSGLRRLSPSSTSINIQKLSPVSSHVRRNLLNEPERSKETFLTPFKVDTPNRKLLVNKGLQNQHPTVLGSGSFGKVYRASYKGDKVAAKLVDRKKHGDSILEAEKHAASLAHENIIKVLAIEEGDLLSVITMELCENSLEEKLEKTSLDPVERVSIWKAIASALRFCHNSGIVHGDVKPKNILFGVDSQPKLADFGSSVLLNESCLEYVFHGTPGYAAPEVVRGEVPTPAADIYSLGVVAWQMLSRKSPFQGLHRHTILYLTGCGSRPFSVKCDDGFNGKYNDLYVEMWAENRRRRPALIVIITELDKLISGVH